MKLQPLIWEGESLKIIDQTVLPHRLVYRRIKELAELKEAIQNLRIRGAPLLGIASAFGVYLGIKESKVRNFKEFVEELDRVIEFLKSSRPTAVNLFWGMERVKEKVRKNSHLPVEKLKLLCREEAEKIKEEDEKICQMIGEHGATLIEDGDGILTHCNAGGLATSGYGTALGVIYSAHHQGKEITVYVDETRPLLQGARLTTWELLQAGIRAVLICDNMAGEVMREGKVKKVIVGADRIARNGDTANKIGSYSLAILSYYHNIPFYVAAPTSTIDPKIGKGSDIPIEIRKKEEITHFQGKEVAPSGVEAYNPAFDVVPSSLISGIITEKGIIYPPYEKSLVKIL